MSRRDAVPGMAADTGLPDAVRAAWLAADWQGVLDAADGTSAMIAAHRAAAASRLGLTQRARDEAREALEAGMEPAALAAVLLCAARDCVASASFHARRERQAEAHMERALRDVRMSSEARRLARQRLDRLGELQRHGAEASARLRRNGAQPAALKAPGWLARLATQCLQSADLHRGVDDALEHEVSLADDRVQFLMLLSDSMLSAGDRVTALHFLNVAARNAPQAAPDISAELQRHLIALDAPGDALASLMEIQLSDASNRLGADAAAALRTVFNRLREKAQAANQHGHELILGHLAKTLPGLQTLAASRQLVLVEIGTTREEVPGQGSTRKLAEFCRQRNLHFITVDMDPHNTRSAQAMFRAMGVGFEAVTMKGEDYLRERSGPIDLVFLDAYDFDHGQHSALRQSRYEKFLGSRIDEAACHQMHLDCAQSVAAKLWRHGVVCIDDTWREGGGWAAKGTLAVPYLLEQGFELVDERNRAVLMTRRQAVR